MKKIISMNVKPYSLKELADIYGVCGKTLKKWIKPFEKELGGQIGRFYTIPQVEIIFERLGYPYMLQAA